MSSDWLCHHEWTHQSTCGPFLQNQLLIFILSLNCMSTLYIPFTLLDTDLEYNIYIIYIIIIFIIIIIIIVIGI